jgi:hypothetical protein
MACLKGEYEGLDILIGEGDIAGFYGIIGFIDLPGRVMCVRRFVYDRMHCQYRISYSDIDSLADT